MLATASPLDQQSLWLQYKRAVWNTGAAPASAVHNIMRVIRAIRNAGELAYISVPITTGRRLYELRRNLNLSEPERLELAIAHNYLIGWEFTERLVGRLDCPVLFPADMTPAHQIWDQADFQALWLSIIAEKCTQLHLVDGWQFSNGGCEEFTHVMQLRLGLPSTVGDLIFYNTKEDEAAERERMRSIRVYDHHGRALDIDDGIRLMNEALRWIGRHSFSAPKIERCLELLLTTKKLLAAGFYQ